MKKAPAVSQTMILTGALFCLLLAAFKFNAQQQEVVDNAKIIELVRLNIGDIVLIPKINSSKVLLDASESALLELKSAGVSDALITAMLERVAVSGKLIDRSRVKQLTELRSGLELKISIPEKISGKNVKPNQKLTFTVAEDVKIDGRIVVARSTPVLAIVADARKPGMMGRSGRLVIYVAHTTTIDGQELKLRGGKSGDDGDHFGSTFTLVAIFGAPGLLRHGKNATIKAGTIFVAYANNSLWVQSNTAQ